MPVVELNGTKINYLQIDSDAGEHAEHLVMVHGLATNMAFWYMRHAAEFAKRYKVTLFDLRGHGRSRVTESGYTPENMSRDLEELLNHLSINKAHFIAHSFGGIVALNFACRSVNRVASLMLVDSHIGAIRKLEKDNTWEYGQKVQQLLHDQGLDISVNEPYFGYRLLATVAHLQKEKVPISDELQELVIPIVGNYGARTAKQWLKLLETTKAEEELMGDDGLTLERLKKLTFPILAVYGERSQAMLTGSHLLEVWPHADFRRVREAGHFFPTTRPAELMQNCEQFWDGALVSDIPKREGDKQRHFRSDRFSERDDGWYFFTREGEHGPYESLDIANNSLSSYIEQAKAG
ncbi:alpha/beta fold hydrolase [Neptuniibacter sp. QD34_54]|uniref:alpha/beta fold hydrolase n=1 Tax=Neptuniibacter sp. QD34_54 TaxID=3398208 RepID=UPI0039F45FBB